MMNMTDYSLSNKQQHESGMIFTLFSIWSFILLCRPQDYLPFLGYLRPSLTLGLLTLLLYVLNAKYTVKFADSQLRLYKYLIIVMIVSVPFSYYRSASLMDLIHYSSIAIFVFLLPSLLNSISKLRALLFLYCLGIAIYALCTLAYGSFTEGRISFGSMFDPNDIAFFIISFVTFNLLFVTNNNRGYVRIISIINLIIGLLIIMKSGSRGGLLALITVIAYLLFIKSSTFKVSFITKAALTAVVLLSLQFVNMNSERYKTIFDLQNDYNITGEEGRLSVWKTGIKLMFAHPFTGVGFNRFPEGVGRDREKRGLDSSKWQTAHNSLIQIGAETGIFGFILFCALSFNAFKIFSQIGKNTEIGELAKIGEFAKVGFLGHFISAMFLSQAYSVYWAFYIGFSAVLKRFVETNKISEPGELER